MTRMRFSVDGWDPNYGSAIETDDIPDSAAAVDAAIEVAITDWAPIPPRPECAVPSSVLFVDGVRRTEARVWIDDEASSDAGIATSRPVAGICASYAAGVVCCCSEGAHSLGAEVRRRLFTSALSATHITAGSETFTLHRVVADTSVPTTMSLSLALQRALIDLEVTVAAEARKALGGHGGTDDNLLIIDGPLRGRAHLPRALGYIKTHHAEYLPPNLNSVVSQIKTAERTPIFALGTGWERYAWYLRLPCRPSGPWTGVVRLEAAPTLDASEVVRLADTSQKLLGRFASVEYKDGRAPQNLVPIAGLEKDMRHQLGHAPLLYRAIRSAAAR